MSLGKLTTLGDGLSSSFLLSGTNDVALKLENERSEK